MTHEYMNGGEPIPAGQRNAGQIGITITFDDGTSQNVYAASKDEMLTKVMGMYGNTRERNRELQAGRRTETQPEGGTTTPVVQTRLTADQRLAVVNDLNDPAKAGEAIVTLVKDATGMDLNAKSEEDAQAARMAHRQRVCEEFVSQTPDWYGSKRNATLLRDRVAAVYGIDEATAQNYAEAYNHLKALGVLESAPANTETPAQGTENEPSAQTIQRPTGTSAPPSRLRGATAPEPPKRESYEDIVRLDPSELERRIRQEPGFLEKVSAMEAQRRA